jgi:hypothetical protein
MSKARFLQAFTVRWCPSPDKAEAVISAGEQIWEILTHRGYGTPLVEPKPRERADWYGRLSEAQQAAFGKFWLAYDHKKGRNEAAMVWPQVPESEWDWVFASAAIEARLWREKPPQGVTRIYAQGWLSAFRWRDHPWSEPAAVGGKASRGESRELSKAKAALASYQNMQRLRPSLETAAEIERLRCVIAELEGKADGR